MNVSTDPDLVTAARKIESESGVGYLHVTIPAEGCPPVLVNVYDDGRIVVMSATHHLKVDNLWDHPQKGTYMRLAPTKS